MATTLVGMFDSIREAEIARDQLVQQGLTAGAVHLTTNDSLGSERSTGPLDSYNTNEHRGFFATLFGLGHDAPESGLYSEALTRGSAMLTVTLPDGTDTKRIETLLENSGAIDVDERSMQWGMSDSVRGNKSNTALADGGETLKVVQEELRVGKRAVPTSGVRVRQFVTERPVTEQIQLCQERAVVARRPVDRVLAAGEMDSMDLKNRTFEVREQSEEAVVQKRARVVEEVSINKEAREHIETVEDTLRRRDVAVEQLTAAQKNAQRQPGNTTRTPPTR